MKAFSRKFYHSKIWSRVRVMVMDRADGLCEMDGCNNPGFIVHHIVELTPDNINDPNVTVAMDNLMYVCKSCHDRIHLGTSSTVEGLIFNVDGSIIKINGLHNV